jgi:hypothetical protein
MPAGQCGVDRLVEHRCGLRAEYRGAVDEEGGDMGDAEPGTDTLIPVNLGRDVGVCDIAGETARVESEAARHRSQ